jgi:integrase
MGVIQAGWTPRGTRRTISVSGATEKEVRAKLNKKRRELDAAGGPAKAVSGRATVKTWAEQWLQIHERKVRPKAFVTDAGAVRRWIIPTIGHKRLGSLTRTDVRALHKAVTDAGRSTTTARQAHFVLMGMLKAAADEGNAQISTEVTTTPAPARAANDRDAIPLLDAIRLRDLARTRPDAARWELALHYGMRQGEALGLTWDALDLSRPGAPLTIEWQLQQLPYADRAAGTFRVPDGYEARHLAGSYHLVRPKSKTGYRVVPIIADLRDHLLRWRDEHAVDNPWGLVWTGTDTRKGRDKVLPRRPAVDRADWIALQDEAGVRHPSGRHYVLHEARHTAATLLMMEGVDAQVISAILGHTIQASKTYKHVSTALAAEALGRSARRLEG